MLSAVSVKHHLAQKDTPDFNIANCPILDYMLAHRCPVLPLLSIEMPPLNFAKWRSLLTLIHIYRWLIDTWLIQHLDSRCLLSVRTAR